VPLTRPWTDWFGTRLDPDALLEGLGRIGLRDAQLSLTDSGVQLVISEATEREHVSLGLVWLREQLSPLMQCTVQAVPSVTPGIKDLRTRSPKRVVLAESWSPGDLPTRLADLVERLGDPTPPSQELPWPGDALGDQLSAALTRRGWDPRAVGAVAFPRPGGAIEGVRPATIIAASTSLSALRWLQGALADPAQFTPATAREGGVLLDGLVWGAARRPTVAIPQSLTTGDAPVWTDPERCIECAVCTAMCPTNLLDERGAPKPANAPSTFACIQCYECVDACPSDAIRPVYGDDAATHSRALSHRGPWLSRLRGAPGPLQPAPFPPSYLLPRAGEATGPVWTLGLAILTMAEHAAVLLKDGQLVGAVEEEKLVRIRHYGRRLSGRPDFVTPAVDPTLLIEEALCHHSIASLLDDAGITLDDLDTIAVNGLHGRYRHAFTHLDDGERLPVIRAGRLVSVPHHLCHAASSYRVAGVDDAWIFTVDGRGDRETAAIFRAENGHIQPVATLLSLDDQSVGGVYQTVTEELGFGSFGQGSLMALAGFGAPSTDLSPYLSARSAEDVSVHETGLREALAGCRRTYDEPIEARHKDMAASIQAALEAFAVSVVGSATGAGPIDALCLAGGVTLNCHMNRELKLALKPEVMFVQPAANDGGTALGAAAEAWALEHEGQNLGAMTHAQWGPEYDDASLARALRRSGLTFSAPEDLSEATAARLETGEIVAWFQGRLEYGPRALGGRSLLADPRHPEITDRLNRLKDRQLWRPFAPSILAGHEGEWFVDGFDSRFMLFTLPVAEDKRDLVPAIVHVDGTSRPQVVHADVQPAYHALISAFYAKTGVPMVIDTSFNRRGEPIVNTPEEALDAFLALGADVMAMGPYLVEHPTRVAAAGVSLPTHATLASLPSARQDTAFIRLTDHCSLGCSACPVSDAEGPLVTWGALQVRMVEAREAGHGALTLVVGDPEVQSAHLSAAIRDAHLMGFHDVAVRTHGGGLGKPGVLPALRDAGMSRAELVLLAVSSRRHDALCPTPGAMAGVGSALQATARAGVLTTIVPLLRGVLPRLHRILDKMNVLAPDGPVVLRYPHLRLTPEGLIHAPVVPVEAAVTTTTRALMAVTTLPTTLQIQGLPSCLFEPPWRDIAARSQPPDWPRTAPCPGCGETTRCAALSPRYLSAVGSGELGSRRHES
jgi:predicted NodU family carbamoyl transferase/NAD-dependent dihydropyrimidine dehydrogenase PreA subunit